MGLYGRYQQYVAGYQDSVQALGELRKDKALAEMLTKGYEMCKFDIGSLLIEPVHYPHFLPNVRLRMSLDCLGTYLSQKLLSPVTILRSSACVSSTGAVCLTDAVGVLCC